MGKQKKDYEIVIFTPDTQEQIMHLKNEIGKAYGEFIIEHLTELDISYKQITSIYRKIIKEIR
ncbi:hypothetical protein [Ruminiclostridium cellulolyticum]|uniref:Uncharacterized protein n=1 Tax=Ruminiclostridium cellulolyticum (strain ATCC 35319 / DSM 5812 / JCM 6584 / H10) TaxID=394503 RepID=B8I6C9_RUMCH|nr:hypothetical protein [Ruminiclostridium cellulolyticum]ACL74821.1 hypothetical protein Ccel_0439 [Ruminiclostridium cellulolyticum H10]